MIAAIMVIANRGSSRIAINALENKPGDVVLELGCGGGHAIHALDAQRSAQCIFGIDHSITMLKQAALLNSAGVREHHVQLLRGRIDALPLRDNSIDKILAAHVVYFADATAIREARRVLRAGGRMVLVATDRAAMQHWRLENSHRLYNAHDLARLLAEGGFTPNELTITAVPLMGGVPGILAIANKTNCTAHNS
jgi:ubiquinone/menaquinone biosynthesis C-methylase UbiE